MDIDVADAFFAALVALLVTEGLAWLPRLTRRIVQIAARRLSPDLRSRLEEEWLRYIEDMPGTLGPFVASCQCLMASTKILPIGVRVKILRRFARLAKLRDNLRGSFTPLRAKPYGRNAREFSVVQRLGWVFAVMIGIALGFGFFVAGVEALTRLGRTLG